MKRTIWGTAFLLLLANIFCLFGCGGSDSGGDSGSEATLSSIAVTPANPAVLVEATQQFTATGTYSDSTTADITATVTWSSSDTSKATIDSSGLATAVAAGSPAITATLGNVSGSTNPAMYVAENTTTDVHAHANSATSGTETAQDLTNLLAADGISKTIIMQTPAPTYTADPDNTTADDVAFLSGQGSAYLYMYGGSELQPMLFAAGQTAEITTSSVYPSGGATLSNGQHTVLNDIRTNPSDYEATFLARAHTAADSGIYVGFGELAPYHMSLRSTHPQMSYAADSAWMLLLSDLAAEHNMVMDVHMEETSEKLAELSNLLSYNTNTKIIWDHAGWSNTGGATAAVFTQMLADHPNLYLNLKMRDCDTDAMKAGCPTNDDGSLKSEWETLLTTYADRIMVGTDAKYWSDPTSTMEEELEKGFTRLNTMIDLLPTDTALRIRNITARTLFGLAP